MGAAALFQIEAQPEITAHRHWGPPGMTALGTSEGKTGI